MQADNFDRPAKSRIVSASFVEHRLRVILTLYKGTFASGSNATTIDDLAISAKIQKLPFPDFGKASIEITNMPLDDMEKLTTLAFHPLYQKRNYVNVYAGDDLHGYTEIFAGNIVRAAADLNSTPDVKLKIEAQVGFWGRITADGATAVRGSQPAADFIAGQVQKAGFTFENRGVTAQLRNSVYNGSPIHQAMKAAKQIGAELVLDDNRAILIPAGGAVNTAGNAILINKDTGLLKYPTVTQNGIELTTVFNPALRFAGIFKLETEVPKASGAWRIIKLSHDLSANSPRQGKWESKVTGFYPHMSGAIGRFI